MSAIPPNSALGIGGYRPHLCCGDVAPAAPGIAWCGANPDKMPRSLSLTEKVQIIRECQRPGATQSQVAAKWELHRSVVCRIWQQKEKLLADYEAGQSNGCRKRGREGKAPAVDRALFTWLKEKRAQGAMLAGPAVKEKARQLAASLGLNDFKASDGWFTRWKKRFNVACEKEQGGKQSADKPTAEQWQCEKLPRLLEKFSLADIYNADETGLYLKGLWDRGLGEKNEKQEGGKASKDRVTVLVCANMDGSDKRPLVMIGTSKRPRCFPVDFRKLPLNYVSSANAWMTGEIFIKWLKKWDRQLCWQSRQICLFLANCSVHPQGVVLTNIQLEFLPPNATSSMQPMAQGVIENMKGHYRSKIASRINVALHVDPSADVQTVLKTVNLLDCVHLVAEAWQDVKPTTISNCFRKGKFVVAEEGGRDEDIDDPLNDVPLPGNMEKEDLVTAVAADEDLLTFGELTHEELLRTAAAARPEKRACVDETYHNAEDTQESEDDFDEGPSPTNSELLKALNTLRHFSQLEGLGDRVYRSLWDIESHLQNKIVTEKKQSKLTEFFHPK
ncbi:major centromere autoantigen B [Malaclemys terrapin pileata]|uniref:major centromere autoantigen B n=1 Tax=Malaclemys terrapin pileata TaxID=2991368 RepID=UPI0023A8B86B|nr:major centromere autoantigen B [Malaclemys terrapin pileata]